MACTYCYAEHGNHYTGCKYATGVAVMKSSTTDQYAADAQLQRDIEAARGVKPAGMNCIEAMVSDGSAMDANGQVYNMKASQRQEGGSHYTKLKIQPMEYSMANNLNAGQHTVVKYVTRYRDKGGLQDLRKAIHTLELMIEIEQQKEDEAIRAKYGPR